MTCCGKRFGMHQYSQRLLALIVVILASLKIASVWPRNRVWAAVPAHACVVAPVSFRELRQISAKFQDTLARKNRTAIERRTAAQLPLFTRAILRALAAYIRMRSGCSDGYRLILQCPSQADWVGLDLAIIVESVRRSSFLNRESKLCEGTLLSTPDLAIQRNSAGAMLQEIHGVRALARAHAAALGLTRMHRTMASKISVTPSMFGTGYLEILFGFLLESPCPLELKRVCGRSPSVFDIDNLTDCTDGRQPCSLKAALARLAPPRIAEWRFAVGRDNVTQKRLEAEITDPALAAHLSQQYERMRQLVPLGVKLPTHDTHGVPIVNVALHIRAGKGAHALKEASFVAFVDFVLRTLRSVASPDHPCKLHLHALREYATCCTFLKRWSDQADKGNSTDGVQHKLHVHLDINRLQQWDLMWQSDVVVSGFSKMSRLIGALSPNVVLLLDPDVRQMHAVRAHRVNWTPCGRQFDLKNRRIWTHLANDEGKCLAPVVGLADPAQEQEVSAMIARVCTQAGSRPGRTRGG